MTELEIADFCWNVKEAAKLIAGVLLVRGGNITPSIKQYVANELNVTLQEVEMFISHPDFELTVDIEYCKADFEAFLALKGAMQESATALQNYLKARNPETFDPEVVRQKILSDPARQIAGEIPEPIRFVEVPAGKPPARLNGANGKDDDSIH